MDLKYNQRVIVQDLNKFWVNGEEFDGITYQGLLSVNTKTYVEEPTRSNDGSIPNIEDHDTFFVPQVKFSLKYFSIGDYQRLCRAVNSSNEFPVRYWDKQFGDFRTYMMYMKPEEMHKLYNVRTSVFGVLDYEIEFVATLNDLESYTVKYITNGLSKREINEYSISTTYNLNDIVKSTVDGVVNYYKYINETSSSGKELNNTEYWEIIYDYINQTINVNWGNSIKVLTSTDLTNFYNIPSGKMFVGWNTRADGQGFSLKPNANFSVFENMQIYPILGDAE